MSQSSEPRDDPRQIAKWAERYARSRTIPFLVQWVFILLIVVVLGALSQGALTAWRHEQAGVQWACVVAIAVVTLGLLWFSVARWGQQQIWRISQWVYGKEGYAAYRGAGAAAGAAKRMRWVPAAAALLALYHLVGAVLAGLHMLPMKLLLPFSAPCMILFLGVMIVSQRLGFWAWLWPVLYGLHAVLLAAGAPLPFVERWEFVHIIVAVFGWGALSMVVGHLYSRYALRRLKKLARSGLSETGADAPGPGPEPGGDGA